MKSKFTKLLATALVLCLVLALLPAAAFAGNTYTVTFADANGIPKDSYTFGTVKAERDPKNDDTLVLSNSFNEGDQVLITATPNPGCGLVSLVVEEEPVPISDPADGASYSFTINANTVVKAAFRPFHAIAYEDCGGGSVSTSKKQAMREDKVVVTATPEPGYSVESVYYYKNENSESKTTISAVNGVYSFEMPEADVTVGATFEAKETFAITTATSELGYVTAPASAYEGQVVSVSATATASGASVESIKITKTSDGEEYRTITGASGTFDMPAFPVTVKAVFGTITPPVTDTYSIVLASKITGGTLDSDKAMASAYETVTITATPYSGYKTVEVYYILSGSFGLKVPARYVGNNQWQFTMPDAAVEVYATFKYDPYYPGTDYHYINVTNPGWHCSVNVPSGAYCGEYVTIKLSNFDTGYAFSYLKVDGVSVKPYAYNGYLAYTFKMPSHSVAIEVGTTSVSGKYYIDTSYDSTLGGVEVWVNNNYVNNWHQGSWADYKDSVSFKVKPYYSDDVVSVSVVGKRTGWTYSYDYNSYSGWYTFTMPNEDVTINVDFRSGVHKVYVDKVTDGKLTVSDDWAKYGQIVYITAVPDYGCTLSSLSVRTATGDSVHVYNAQKADTYYFYMPDQYVSVSAVFTGKYTSVPFNDVSYGDWYYDAVQFVYSRGIMDGVDYYKFAPNGTITRGMILTMLWRMAGEPFEMPVTSFTDVEIGRYYTTAVAWACRNGIADGMGETKFGPNDAITREELVTLLYRYAQYFGHSCIGTSIEGFADAGSVSSYAYNAMCWAYKAGVVTGTTGSRLNPQGTASRAEAAQMIMSFYSFLNS